VGDCFFGFPSFTFAIMISHNVGIYTYDGGGGEPLFSFFVCKKERGERANGKLSTDENASKKWRFRKKRGEKRLYLKQKSIRVTKEGKKWEIYSSSFFFCWHIRLVVAVYFLHRKPTTGAHCINLECFGNNIRMV